MYNLNSTCDDDVLEATFSHVCCSRIVAKVSRLFPNQTFFYSFLFSKEGIVASIESVVSFLKRAGNLRRNLDAALQKPETEEQGKGWHAHRLFLFLFLGFS